MKHSLPAYTGNEGYVFISYSHRDSEAVLAILARLVKEGVRLWYDEGIDPGTEWDENIAAHIEQCDTLLSFLSANYLQSENCKDELNYARDLNKDRLLVYLEDVKLPSGMAMRLNRLQSIHMYTYQNREEFFGKLIAAPVIQRNRGLAPTHTFAEKASDSAQKVIQGLSTVAEKTKDTFDGAVQAIKNPTEEERRAAESERLQDPPSMVPTVHQVPPPPTVAPPPPPINPFTTGKVATPLADILKKTEELVQSYQPCSRYYVNGSPQYQKRIESAHNSYARYSIAETPLLMEDFTLFGSAKEGLVLTDTHLYVNNSFSKRVAVPLANVREVSVLPQVFKTFYPVLNTENGDIQLSVFNTEADARKCADFWRELIGYLKGVSAVRAQPVLRNFSPGFWTCSCGTLCKDAFCPNCGRKKI